MKRAVVLACLLAALGGGALAQVSNLYNGAVPGSSTPPPADLDGAVGSSTLYARADHTHAVNVQRTVLVTDNQGNATWTFARPIVVTSGKVPPVAFMVEDTGSPVVVQITARQWTTANGLDTHTGVTIKAQQSQTLPQTLATVAGLVAFDVFANAAVAVRVNLFAANPTQ